MTNEEIRDIAREVYPHWNWLVQHSVTGARYVVASQQFYAANTIPDDGTDEDIKTTLQRINMTLTEVVRMCQIASLDGHETQQPTER